MPGTMSKADLVADLESLLMDAAKKIGEISPDGDVFERQLDMAALALSRYRPRTLVGTLTLIANQPNYPAPDDLIQPKTSTWGQREQRCREPWARNHPGRLPSIRLVENEGARELWLSPSPSAAQISALSSSYPYFYSARHVIADSADNTTVRHEDRDLLLMRAAAQALQELAHNGVTKPIRLGSSGVGSMPKNGHPAVLAEALIKLFERMAA